MSHANRRGIAGFPRRPKTKPASYGNTRMMPIVRTPGELAALMTELPEHEALNRACISIEAVYGLGEPVLFRPLDSMYYHR